MEPSSQHFIDRGDHCRPILLKYWSIRDNTSNERIRKKANRFLEDLNKITDSILYLVQEPEDISDEIYVYYRRMLRRHLDKRTMTKEMIPTLKELNITRAMTVETISPRLVQTSSVDMKYVLNYIFRP